MMMMIMSTNANRMEPGVLWREFLYLNRFMLAVFGSGVVLTEWPWLLISTRMDAYNLNCVCNSYVTHLCISNLTFKLAFSNKYLTAQSVSTIKTFDLHPWMTMLKLSNTNLMIYKLYIWTFPRFLNVLNDSAVSFGLGVK